jgi:hypothetical protein
VFKGSVKGDRLSVLLGTKTRNYTVETSSYIGPLTRNPNPNESTASPTPQEPSPEPRVKLAVEKSGKSDPRPTGQSDESAPASNGAKVLFSSEPIGADIYVDGKFMGNTPSQIQLAAGSHTIRIEAKGEKTWTREVSLTPGGKITIHALLEMGPQT